VAKYVVTGIIKLEGNVQDVNKRLEANPKTKIPQILFTVYQHVFSSIYILSSVLSTPYPPPDLLHPMQEKIQILPENGENGAARSKEEEKPQTSQAGKAAETVEKPSQEPKVFVGKPEAEVVQAAQ
jgi:hypothetical protein